MITKIICFTLNVPDYIAEQEPQLEHLRKVLLYHKYVLKVKNKDLSATLSR